MERRIPDRRAKMMKNILTPAGLLILLLAADVAFTQSEPTKPAKAKHVFTNEDLSKFAEKFGPEAQPAQVPASKTTANVQNPAGKAMSEAKTSNGDERARWAGKLKDAEGKLQKAKADQAKYTSALEKFEQKHQDAQTDFQRNLTQNQVADSQKNLTRSTDEVKQAEEAKSKLLADAAQKGFKPADLGEGAETTGLQK